MYDSHTTRVVTPLFTFCSIRMEDGENRINYKKGDVNGAHI